MSDTETARFTAQRIFSDYGMVLVGDDDVSSGSSDDEERVLFVRAGALEDLARGIENMNKRGDKMTSMMK